MGNKDIAENTELNPRTKSTEFGGPLGAGFLILSLPATVYGLFMTVNKTGAPPSWLLKLSYEGLKSAIRSMSFFNLHAVYVIIIWFAFQVLLERTLPSNQVTGTLLRDKKTRLKYKTNAFKAFIVSGVALDGMTYIYGLKPLVWVANNVVPLSTASMVLASLISLHMYQRSFEKGALLALGGNTGNPIYDFWIGRELNPRIGNSFDWKYFCELRPGLIGWTVLNASFAAKQFVELGRITDSMMLVNVFQLYYVVDALWNESAVLTTMDIVQDGFGFMLAFGDLTWVPFTYCLQARYLADHPNDLGLLASAAIISLKLFGLYIFRSANSQKNAFRTNPEATEVKHLKYIETSTGSRLIISEWWGAARHINYTGDWLMAVAWCLPTGFKTPLTYFYPIYFAILLLHRAMRDDEKCRNKYGKSWEEYCRKVPYLFVPYIF